MKKIHLISLCVLAGLFDLHAGELTEGNAIRWGTFASDGAVATVSNEAGLVRAGTNSLRFDTASGFDTGVRYPQAGAAHWNLPAGARLDFWNYGQNSNFAWQGPQPVVVLNTASGSFRYEPDQEFTRNGQWTFCSVPLAGGEGWTRTTAGSPTLTDVWSLELHQDTWDYGFTVFYDGVEFTLPGGSPVELPADASTTLLLHFNGNLTGAAGEAPTTASGFRFEPGIIGQAAYVNTNGRILYARSGNITSTQGTVEMWIRPPWNGNSNQGYTFFVVGQRFENGLILALDGANNLRFIQWGDDPSTPATETAVERGVGFGASDWVAGQWYHLAGTWDGATREVTLYVNGQQVDRAENGVNLPSFSTTTLAVGAELNGTFAALASLDEFRISIRARPASEILESYLNGLGLLDTNPPVPPSTLTARPDLSGVRLDWTASSSPDVAGYVVFRRDSGGSYPATPLATIHEGNATSFLDTSAFGGQGYFYKVAAFDALDNRSDFSNEAEVIVDVVTDLAVTYIERLPRDTYRYSVNYPNDVPTLAAGTENQKRWPDVGETVTFVGHILNRGTVPLAEVPVRWLVNGAILATDIIGSIPPHEEITASLNWTWNAPYPNDDHSDQTITFEVDPEGILGDATPQNNALTDFLEGMSLAIYVAPELYADFATRTNLAGTMGFEDWLQAQIREMNDVFAHSIYPLAPEGARERVRVDRIVVGFLPDDDAVTDGRWSFAANPDYAPTFAERIDGGLIHELMHQLGLIDLYQVQLSLEGNAVVTPDGAPVRMENLFYRSGLMGGGDITPHFGQDDEIYLSQHDVVALNRHCGYRRGYFGEYLFDVPEQIELLVLDAAGQPVPGAHVRVFQGGGGSLPGDPVALGLTDAAGRYALPNRTPNGLVTTATGHTLRPNAFGSIHVVGFNGVLLFEVSRPGGDFDYAWLNITDANLAYWGGASNSWTLPIYSRLASTALARVAGVRSSVEGARTQLQWELVPGATSYRVYRASRFANRAEDAAHGYENWILRPLDSVNTLSFTDLTFDETSQYAIAAMNGSGEGPLSERIFAPLLQNPWAVVVGTNGLRTVLDPQNGYALLRQAANGNYLSTVGSAHYHLEFSRFMAFDPGLGRLILSHPGDYYTARHSVRVADWNGNGLLEFGDNGSANGEFNDPAGVAVDAEHRIYVVDRGNHRVQVFSSNGEFLTALGSAGGGDGQFTDAQGIAVDATHRVFVCDRGNARVQVLQFNGSQLSYAGTLNHVFNAPVGIAIGIGGRLYVSDMGTSRIEEFSPQGAWLRSYEFPDAPASGRFSQPTGLAMDSSGALVVCDTGNRRVVTVTVPGVPPRLGISPPATAGMPVTLQIHASPGLTLRLEASTNLVNWTTLQTLTVTTNPIIHPDPASVRHPWRFYRTVIP